MFQRFMIPSDNSSHLCPSHLAGHDRLQRCTVAAIKANGASMWKRAAYKRHAVTMSEAGQVVIGLFGSMALGVW